MATVVKSEFGSAVRKVSKPSTTIDKGPYEVALSRLMDTCNYMADLAQKLANSDKALIVHRWEALAERRVYKTIAEYIKMVLTQGIAVPEPPAEDPLTGVIISSLYLKYGQLALQESLQEPVSVANVIDVNQLVMDFDNMDVRKDGRK